MGHDIVKDEKEQKRQFLDSCSEAAAGGVPGGCMVQLYYLFAI